MDPFIAEIRIFAGNFAPIHWALCDGQIMPIQQNTPLFSLLGTTYGGDGRTNFALPNLQDSSPMAPGQGPGLSLHDLGEAGGEGSVALNQSQIPTHSHALLATNAATIGVPSNGTVFATTGGANIYGGPTHTVAMSPGALQPAGTGPNSSPHENRQPFLTLSFIIALQGVFPARS